jgi:CO dehydrogenase nickel-insertion accessory protein CooC1
MDELAGNAHISFEGNLGGLGLLRIPGASEETTSVLKRNTLWPKQDFVVVPLEPSMSKTILSAVGGTLPKKIIHIQVEKAGILEFGTYDNFSSGCIFFGSAVGRELIESLVSQGVLNSRSGA